ncbi:MAG: ATP-dependent DNA helicase RecG [Clostridia bacterium]|nr:ATP-dependent DNA helicase RecG [Clostridia bacterium]
MNETKLKSYKEIINSPLVVLNGIGRKRAELFGKMGVSSVGDLTDHFPRAYQNRGNVRLLNEAESGLACSFMLTVATVPRTARLKNRMEITKFRAFDESGRVEICFFNSRFAEKVFDVGQTWRFWGRIAKGRNGLTMTAPVYERADIPGTRLPDLVPVYPSTAGLTQSVIADAVKSAFGLIGDRAPEEIIPPELMLRTGVPDRMTAYRFVHFPQTVREAQEGRRYFALREIFEFVLAIRVTRSSRNRGTPPSLRKVSVGPYLEKLGFTLTGAQKRSVDEILNDMTAKGHPMMRLLSGDVGSGKTAVAGAAAYVCAAGGYQCALMAPTEILAAQHYGKLSPIFEKLGLKTALLTGGLKESEKKRVREGIASGETDVVIGTHALISKNTFFARPGLTIIDEQHRFGVIQRACVAENTGEKTTPHVLVMSATPIPRTMGLVMFGELSHSVLDELPPGRQEIKTYCVDFGYTERLDDFIRKQVSEGGRVYVVCPAIEREKDPEDLLSVDSLDQEKTELHYAVEEYERLKESLGEISVGLVHGRMKAAEKDGVMELFASGKIQVLVSTTVIEVGVDVPEATLMIIENAERFGLATLHQLRGRVGRGKKKSFCILVSDSKGENAVKRLGVMKDCSDGFRIAEFDLQQRGPGDYLPDRGYARQHGESAAPLLADVDMLRESEKSVSGILDSDPDLSAHPALREAAGEIAGKNERLLQ